MGLLVFFASGFPVAEVAYRKPGSDGAAPAGRKDAQGTHRGLARATLEVQNAFVRASWQRFSPLFAGSFAGVRHPLGGMAQRSESSVTASPAARITSGLQP